MISISPKQPPQAETVPFDSVEEAWFWFITAQAARMDGAKFNAGKGLVPRPCEPIDILRVLDRLCRQRCLLRDHLLVLRYYGRRYMAPDPMRVKEYHAHVLWTEAMEKLEAVFIRKGVVVKKFAPPFGFQSEFALEGVAAE